MKYLTQRFLEASRQFGDLMVNNLLLWMEKHVANSNRVCTSFVIFQNIQDFYKNFMTKDYEGIEEIECKSKNRSEA